MKKYYKSLNSLLNQENSVMQAIGTFVYIKKTTEAGTVVIKILIYSQYTFKYWYPEPTHNNLIKPTIHYLYPLLLSRVTSGEQIQQSQSEGWATPWMVGMHRYENLSQYQYPI